MSSNQDGEVEGLKKNSEQPHVSASSDMSTYTRAMLFGLVWWAIIIFFYIQGVTTKTTASCLASTNIITVLQMVPYKLHSPDLQSAVFTINKIYNVQATFFDIADPLFGTTPAPGKSLPPFASGGYAGKPWREYNKFSLNSPLPNTIAGSTNWMEYTVVFNKQADVSPTCLAPFKDFFFINADGTCQGCA